MRRDRTETDTETETERARESARERCSRTSRQTDSLHAPARIKEPRAHCVKMRWGHRWGWSAAESGDLRRVVCRKCLTLLAFRDQVRTKRFLHAWSSLPACLPPSSLPFSTHSPPFLTLSLSLARSHSLTHSLTGAKLRWSATPSCRAFSSYLPLSPYLFASSSVSSHHFVLPSSRLKRASSPPPPPPSPGSAVSFLYCPPVVGVA